MSGAPVPGETYVTRDGDTLRGIARAAYGDAAQWRLIYEANLHRVKMNEPETEALGAGVRFELPQRPKERVTGSFAARERATGPQPMPERERLTKGREKAPERERHTAPRKRGS